MEVNSQLHAPAAVPIG